MTTTKLLREAKHLLEEAIDELIDAPSDKNAFGDVERESVYSLASKLKAIDSSPITNLSALSIITAIDDESSYYKCNFQALMRDLNFLYSLASNKHRQKRSCLSVSQELWLTDIENRVFDANHDN